jgi:hypothetical protein
MTWPVGIARETGWYFSPVIVWVDVGVSEDTTASIFRFDIQEIVLECFVCTCRTAGYYNRDDYKRFTYL